ncbi:MAG: conjugal transfer protein TrbD [Azospira oryzae]|nr:MAG: conjugal transfer protein TrbD [Azospira oryzae]PZP82951.1 MAG: conjugal transfer protein TrbD [Azospira oryzae]
MKERRVSMVFRSLAEPQTLGGVERRLAIVNGTLAVAASAALWSLWYLPIAWAVHRLLKWLTKRDPFFREIYVVYNRHADVYEPWPDGGLDRPHGFGRGLPW